MRVRASNLGLRFYEIDGWTFDILHSRMEEMESNSLIYFKDKFTGYFIFKKASNKTKENVIDLITEVEDMVRRDILTREKDRFEFEHLINFNFD